MFPDHIVKHRQISYHYLSQVLNSLYRPDITSMAVPLPETDFRDHQYGAKCPAYDQT